MTNIPRNLLKDIQLSPPQEQYLVTIHHLCETAGSAHAKPIADKLGVTKASVTGALRALAELGLIHYEPYKAVTLTPLGLALARKAAERHSVLYRFLKDVLGIDSSEADASASKMEHSISKEVLSRFVRFIGFFETCKNVQFSWHQDGSIYCDFNSQDPNCLSCKGPNPAPNPLGRPPGI